MRTITSVLGCVFSCLSTARYAFTNVGRDCVAAGSCLSLERRFRC
jgi:hypothetical protein